jgi:hypothetical protein
MLIATKSGHSTRREEPPPDRRVSTMEMSRKRKSHESSDSYHLNCPALWRRWRPLGLSAIASSGLLSSFSFPSCCLAMVGEFEHPKRNTSLGCLTLVFFRFTPAAIRLPRKKHLLQDFEAVGANYKLPSGAIERTCTFDLNSQGEYATPDPTASAAQAASARSGPQKPQLFSGEFRSVRASSSVAPRVHQPHPRVR